MNIGPHELSPASWLAVIKPRIATFSDTELLSIIAVEANRRQSLHSTNGVGNHLVDIMRDLGIAIRKPVRITCKCGETHNIK